MFWKEQVEIFDDTARNKAKKISKLHVISIIVLFLFIFVQGTIQVKKAHDYQNDPSNGFGYSE